MTNIRPTTDHNEDQHMANKDKEDAQHTKTTHRRRQASKKTKREGGDWPTEKQRERGGEHNPAVWYVVVV